MFQPQDRAGEGLTAEQADAVARWQETLIGVAIEEMLHLALVNVLRLVMCDTLVRQVICDSRKHASRLDERIINHPLWHTLPMSFDVFFQGFLAGESSERGGAQMREVLAPHISEEDGAFLRVRVGDGEADIYLHDGGMMANHIEGRDPWDLLVQEPRQQTGSSSLWAARHA